LKLFCCVLQFFFLFNSTTNTGSFSISADGGGTAAERSPHRRKVQGSSEGVDRNILIIDRILNVE
jgi:hypothetical protein